MNEEHATTGTSRRLAEIRRQWMLWSAVIDTSTWEVTFFLNLLEQKNGEIAMLRKRLRSGGGDDGHE